MKLESCIVCGSSCLSVLLDLGKQCIASKFHKANETLEKYPLQLCKCDRCSMLQLSEALDSDVLYKHYWYRSGVNDTMKCHLKGIVDSMPVAVGDMVLDIGCNDGTLLSFYPNGVRKVGVDPSDVTPGLNCDVFVNNYFCFEYLEEYAGRFSAITALAMFYDLVDPSSFLESVRMLLKDDGVFVLEISYLPSMLVNNSFDTICHEHVAYYRMETLNLLLDRAGLLARDIQFNSTNGGSFLVHICKKRPDRTVSHRVTRAIEEERLGGYDSKDVYCSFERRSRKIKDALMNFLEGAKCRNELSYGYGASTKGQVTLQWCGIDTSLLSAIAERNPYKYGFFTPGTNIPIVSEQQMRDSGVKNLIVLPWHFKDEIVKREASLLGSGVNMVFPMPGFHVE